MRKKTRPQRSGFLLSEYISHNCADAAGGNSSNHQQNQEKNHSDQQSAPIGTGKVSSAEIASVEGKDHQENKSDHRNAEQNFQPEEAPGRHRTILMGNITALLEGIGGCRNWGRGNGRRRDRGNRGCGYFENCTAVQTYRCVIADLIAAILANHIVFPPSFSVSFQTLYIQIIPFLYRCVNVLVAFGRQK